MNEVYHMKGTSDTSKGGFGSIVRGRDDTLKSFAANVDEWMNLTLNRKGPLSKDYMTLPAVLGAVGVGKTAIICEGLAACKKYCTNVTL